MVVMRHVALVGTLALVVAVIGCSDGHDSPPGEPPQPEACLPPNRLVAEVCLEPGVADDGCHAGTLFVEVDGSCRPAGMLPEDCGEGFVHDGDVGCEPVLPAESCPQGQMALPGDAACRSVMDCGSGQWGAIPVDATTEYVDGGFVGVSDGSANAPWSSIGEAVAAAAPGALIAVAAGSYVEDVNVSGKSVRLHGVCPEQVELVGTGAEVAALVVVGGASGSEVRGVAIRGDAYGILVTGSEQVVLDRAWVHDNASIGVAVQNDLGPTSVIVRDSLVEGNHAAGMFVRASDVTFESSVVRDTLPDAQGQFGRGMSIEADSQTGAPSLVTVRHAVLERNSRTAIYVGGAEATIEATVVRDTLADALGVGGRGITIEANLVAGVPSLVTVRASLLERNHEIGLFASGSTATIEATVVRDTLPNGQGQFGRGMTIQSTAEVGTPQLVTVLASLVERNHDIGVLVAAAEVTMEATVVRDTMPSAPGAGRGLNIQQDLQGIPSLTTLRASLVERNHEIGVAVFGSVVTIDGTIVRDTLPNALGFGGRGINVQPELTTGAPSLATVRASLVERNHDVGVLIGGSEATVDATVVRDTLLNTQGLFGRGIAVQPELVTGAPSLATVRASLVERNHEFGLLIANSVAVVDASVIAATAPNAGGLFGDGLAASHFNQQWTPASVTVTATRVEESARAGMGSFGSSLSLADTSIACAAFYLEGEPAQGEPFVLEDVGGNACGCPAADGVCKLVSAGLEPPTALAVSSE
jgi:hypothetical protein